jgi:lipopolysaccharide transport system ATP-binding protein
MKQNGTTILFVSHAPGAVWAVCNKGILMDRGISTGVTSIEETCRAYDDTTMRNHQNNDKGQANIGGTGDVSITRTEILNTNYQPISEITVGESFIIRQHVVAQKKLSDVVFRMQINGEIHKALCIIDSYETQKKFYDLPQGESVIDINVTNPNLRPGIFTLGPSILQKDAALHVYYNVRAATLTVRQSQDRFFYADPMASVYLNAEFSCKE